MQARSVPHPIRVAGAVKFDRDLRLSHARFFRYGHPYAVAMVRVLDANVLERIVGCVDTRVALDEIAATISEQAHPGDGVYRLSPDTFAILFARRNARTATSEAEALYRMVLRHGSAFHPSTTSPGLSLAIGLSAARHHQITNPADEARMALRQAEQAHGGMVTYPQGSESARLDRRLKILKGGLGG
jgi:GGDEF domain-containing protein